MFIIKKQLDYLIFLFFSRKWEVYWLLFIKEPTKESWGFFWAGSPSFILLNIIFLTAVFLTLVLIFSLPPNKMHKNGGSWLDKKYNTRARVCNVCLSIPPFTSNHNNWCCSLYCCLSHSCSINTILNYTFGLLDNDELWHCACVLWEFWLSFLPSTAIYFITIPFSKSNAGKLKNGLRKNLVNSTSNKL